MFTFRNNRATILIQVLFRALTYSVSMFNLQSRHSHLKKCAQEFNVGTNQLLEIVNREKRQEESTFSAVTTGGNTLLSTNVQPARNSTGVKRKRRGATNEW